MSDSGSKSLGQVILGSSVIAAIILVTLPPGGLLRPQAETAVIWASDRLGISSPSPSPTAAAPQALVASSAPAPSSAEPSPAPAPTATPETAPARSKENAEEFVLAYDAAMRDPGLAEADLNEWFAFPVDFYREKELTNRTKLLGLLKPDVPARPGARDFSPPTYVAYDRQTDTDVLYMRVDWTDGTDSGSVRVKYVLLPSPTGRPYRVRSQTDGDL